MNDLVWLKLNTHTGQPVLVCANNILFMRTIEYGASDGPGYKVTRLLMMGCQSSIEVRETLEEIAKMLD